ncbi:MAG: SH3 domain-containing protein [Lachnospiraceae bacterium]|nr:SH3 domain-containing protein [Lachnospiraceae bacterium]
MKRRKLMLCLAVLSALTVSLSGCGQKLNSKQETESETQTETVTEKITETEKETESETQKLITSVDYTSKDGSVKITLPDNTWKVTQDADEMRVFSSGSAAMINIVHASTASAMKSLSVMTSEEDLKTSLTKQYSDTNAFDIQSFENNTINGVNTYRYVVKYNATARMWAYSVTYGIVSTDQAYVITGTVTDENSTLLAAVEKSVDSFRVLKDETLKSVTSDLISGTTQKTSETTLTSSTAELATLTDYGTAATLYANDTVNIRIAPGTDADILGSLSIGEKVTVVGETSGWFKVNVNGNIGYVRKDFLVNSPSAVTATETDADSDAATAAELSAETRYGSSVTLYVSSSEVNVRSQPGTSSSIINSLAGGNAVTVIGETDNWFVVSINGVIGYISKAYLTYDSSAYSNSGGNSGGETGGNTGGNSGGNTGGNNGDGSGGNTGGNTTGSQTITGTVVGSTVDTVTLAGDDGHTYTIYTGEANVSTVDGIYDGVYVSVNVDNGQTASDGTLYATGVTGH